MTISSAKAGSDRACVRKREQTWSVKSTSTEKVIKLSNHKFFSVQDDSNGAQAVGAGAINVQVFLAVEPRVVIFGPATFATPRACRNSSVTHPTDALRIRLLIHVIDPDFIFDRCVQRSDDVAIRRHDGDAHYCVRDCQLDSVALPQVRLESLRQNGAGRPIKDVANDGPLVGSEDGGNLAGFRDTHAEHAQRRQHLGSGVKSGRIFHVVIVLWEDGTRVALLLLQRQLLNVVRRIRQYDPLANL